MWEAKVENEELLVKMEYQWKTFHYYDNGSLMIPEQVYPDMRGEQKVIFVGMQEPVSLARIIDFQEAREQRNQRIDKFIRLSKKG